MTLPGIYPGLTIVPVIKADRETSEFKELVGTGFFYTSNGGLMSVAHVLKVQPGKDELLAVLQPPDLGGGYARGVCPIVNVRASTEFDLAVAEVPQARNFQMLRIATEDPKGIPTLSTYDYSTGLRGGWRPDGTTGIRLVPYLWTGVWLTTYEAYEPGMPRPAKIIEVPFPVMKGASGAPLVMVDTVEVVGILFGNVARDLIPPPQMVEKGQPWYLPIGQAIHCCHVRSFLESLQR